MLVHSASGCFTFWMWVQYIEGGTDKLAFKSMLSDQIIISNFYQPWSQIYTPSLPHKIDYLVICVKHNPVFGSVLTPVGTLCLSVCRSMWWRLTALFSVATNDITCSVDVIYYARVHTCIYTRLVAQLSSVTEPYASTLVLSYGWQISFI